MAVFEYRGILVATGKQVTASATRTTRRRCAPRSSAKASCSPSAQEDARRKARRQRATSTSARSSARVSVGDVAMMTRQLATLVGAGIPLVEAVTALIEQVEKDELKRVLTQVRDRLNEGTRSRRRSSRTRRSFRRST